jgi:hypothetical protein
VSTGLPYRRWLCAQNRRKDNVGDLARFAIASMCNWPEIDYRPTYQDAFEAQRELQSTYTDQVMTLAYLRQAFGRSWREWIMQLGGQAPQYFEEDDDHES